MKRASFKEFPDSDNKEIYLTNYDDIQKYNIPTSLITELLNVRQEKLKNDPGYNRNVAAVQIGQGRDSNISGRISGGRRNQDEHSEKLAYVDALHQFMQQNRQKPEVQNAYRPFLTLGAFNKPDKESLDYGLFRALDNTVNNPNFKSYSEQISSIKNSPKQYRNLLNNHPAFLGILSERQLCSAEDNNCRDFFSRLLPDNNVVANLEEYGSVAKNDLSGKIQDNYKSLGPLEKLKHAYKQLSKDYQDYLNNLRIVEEYKGPKGRNPLGFNTVSTDHHNKTVNNPILSSLEERKEQTNNPLFENMQRDSRTGGMPQGRTLDMGMGILPSHGSNPTGRGVVSVKRRGSASNRLLKSGMPQYQGGTLLQGLMGAQPDAYSNKDQEEEKKDIMDKLESNPTGRGVVSVRRRGSASNRLLKSGMPQYKDYQSGYPTTSVSTSTSSRLPLWLQSQRSNPTGRGVVSVRGRGSASNPLSIGSNTLQNTTAIPIDYDNRNPFGVETYFPFLLEAKEDNDLRHPAEEYSDEGDHSGLEKDY